MKRSLKNLLFIIFVFSLHPFSKPYFDAEASICFSNNNACYIVSNEPFQECQDNDYSNNNSSDNDPYGLDVFDRDSEPMSIDDRPDPEPRQINNTNKTKPKIKKGMLINIYFMRRYAIYKCDVSQCRS